MKTEKLPAKKYLRIHDDQFKEWITEIMKQPHMKYANITDLAQELENVYGGVATSHMHKLRALRINVKDYLPKNEN